MPESCGRRLLMSPCVAKCTIRYWASSGLVAVARLALKSSALRLIPSRANVRIASASRRVKGRRGIVSLRAASDEEPSLRCSMILALAGLGVGASTAIPVFIRSSLMEKTGSAMTATVLGAGWRAVNSRRCTARAEAEGRLMTS